MAVIPVMAALGLALYGIDMLVCKINPKWGYVVAIFNLTFLPVGIITFILTQNYLKKKLDTSDVTQYFRMENEEARNKKKQQQKEFKIPASHSSNSNSPLTSKKKVNTSAPDSQKSTQKSTPLAHEGLADGLLSLIISKGPKQICRREFEGHRAIGSVVIPEGVEIIGDSAFAHCTGLKYITLPDTLKIIDEYAFDDCTGLSSVIIPQGTVSIKEYAFKNCYNLTSVVIPDSVYEISDTAFTGCGKVNIHREYKASSMGASELMNIKEAFSLSERAPDESGGMLSVIIGKGVADIRAFSFADCEHIVSVVIPDGVKQIGENAFKSCHNLESVEIPDTVERIEEGAFSYCHKLKKIMLPDFINVIKKDTFYMCTDLSTVNIPCGVWKIEKTAFAYCSALRRVSIPRSVREIDVYAFSGCSALTSVTIDNSECNIKSNSFHGCNNLSAESQMKIREKTATQYQPDCEPAMRGYATPEDDPYYVSDGYFEHDPDYQDYLQGNIRPSRYQIERKVADNGKLYTTLKSDRTEISAYYRNSNKDSESKESDNSSE